MLGNYRRMRFAMVGVGREDEKEVKGAEGGLQESLLQVCSANSTTLFPYDS